MTLRTKKLSFWLVCLLTALALGSAVLQLRWINALSRLEGEQLQRALMRQSNLTARTFERELGRLILAFPGPSDVLLQQQLAEWRLNVNEPDLLRAVYRYDFSSSELLRIEGPISDRQPAATVVEWPPELLEVETRLTQIARALRNQRIRDPRGIYAALGGSPLIAQGSLLVRPLAGQANSLAARRRSVRRSTPPRATRPSLLLLQLDPALLRQSLSRLVQTRLEEDLGLRIEAALFDQRSRLVGTIRSGEWTPAGDLDEVQTRAARQRYRDAIKVPIAASRAFVNNDRLRTLLEGGGGPALPDVAPPLPQDRRGSWVLAVRLQEGTVQSAVARQRLGSLLLSGLVVVLLASSGILLYRNARRAEEFAQRQTDFVASMSHEMHTPLAAISSAGANLADGVIEDPLRIRQYGEMLQKEGKRLARTVGQALALAGVESNVGVRGSRSGTLLQAVLQAVEETSLVAEQASGEVLFDREAMRRAPALALHHEDLVRVIENLLTNSFKYGAHRVALTHEVRSALVCLHVEDDGPGIPKEDEERIWEPFRRGRQRTESALAGSGLGLYLVARILEQSQGRIRLAARGEGRQGWHGAHFVLELPTAAPPTQGIASPEVAS